MRPWKVILLILLGLIFVIFFVPTIVNLKCGKSPGLARKEPAPVNYCPDTAAPSCHLKVKVKP